MKEYLMKGTKQSSMRLGFIHAIFVSCYGGFILAILDIVLNEGKNLIGVAAVQTGLAGVAFYGKKEQSKTETKENE
jgi:hypothetical protein